MDKNAERLLRQIKKFQKSMSAYEKARVKMITTELRNLRLTDADVQKELKAIGVDVASLLKDTAAEAEELEEVHKKLLALKQPPVLPGVLDIPPVENVFDVVAPAIDGFSTHCAGIDLGINLDLAEINLKSSRQGSGWGWQAVASGPPCLTTLVFQFTPPAAGDILVDPYVSCIGQFAVSAHDHWYTNTEVDLTLSVSSSLYQHYWEFGPSVKLIDEHRTNSSNSAWISRILKLSYSTSVSANDPVLIFVEVSFDALAHSSHARYDLDFKTGADRRIRVFLIRITYLNPI